MLLQWQEASERLAIYLRAAVGNRHDAEDLQQRIATVVLKKQSDFDPDKGSFISWVFGIARYEVLMFRRKQARDRLVFQDTLQERMAAETEQMPIATQREDFLKFCLKQLAPKAREAIRLCYGDQELSPTEAAKRMGIERNHLYVMLHRTRQTLRTCIERCEQKVATHE